MRNMMNSAGPSFLPEVAEENTTSLPQDESPSFQWVPVDTSIGLILAFSSCFFIGISVIYKKLALKDLEAQGETRAVDGGYGYLRLKKWWLGITLMALGELTNFVAYIFAPAILVTPLGVFSIVWTASLSPYFLKETLHAIGKLGCVLVLVGCVIVTLCGPKDREVATMDELQSQLLHPGFLIYSAIVVGTSFILMALVPRYGHRYVMLYITICSSFGSLSVMFCKGVGLALKQTIIGSNEFVHWPTWVCLISLISCLLIETMYMQRALDLFNSSVFMSVNYVMFTSLVIIASSILYTELRELGWKNIVLTILGFVVNIVALYLLHLDKDDKSQQVPVSDSTIHSPDQDPETPLMVAKFVEKQGIEHSPLSNIKLSPSILKENASKLLSFLGKDCLSDSSLQDRHLASPINRRESNVADNVGMCSTVEESSKTLTPQRTCEVPLITKLRSSSSINNNYHQSFDAKNKSTLESVDHENPRTILKCLEKTLEVKRTTQYLNHD